MSENTKPEITPKTLEETITTAIERLKSLRDYLSVAKHLCEFEIESLGHGTAVQDALFGMMDFIPVDGCILDLEGVLEVNKRGVTS